MVLSLQLKKCYVILDYQEFQLLNINKIVDFKLISFTKDLHPDPAIPI